MKISQGTIVRTVVLTIALLNQIFAITGKGTLNITENDVYQLATVLCTVGTSLVAWWKNNSFTQMAILADENLQNMREEAKEQKEGEA